ncbi:unnamed protein product [Durusdinium trenchii]|uniref:Uncharacterized protein n=1 Tax=Durusdinium trenchii TaxID=1381693 RepID=A0ABP0HPG4_9DINO
MNMDAVASSYTNMMLGFRGGERQPPNVLQMSLRFSAIMETRSMQGLHSKDWSAEDRLRKVVQEFHSTNGMLQKWFLDEDKVHSILNMITATSAGSRELIANHLHKFKWSQSALTSELLRKPRWLLKAVPRGCQPHFKVLLTVTETSQEMFLALVYSPVPPQDAKSPTEPEAAVQAEAEPARWTVKNLCLWTEMVQRETPATAMGVAVDQKTVEEKEEELENAAFASLKAKIANLGIAMDDLHYVAAIDFTKLGCVGQQDINQHAQWMSNVLAKNPLRGKHTIIYHATSYDAAWEKAAVQLSCPVIGLTMDLACHKLASKLLCSHLLEEWKRDSGMIKGARCVPDSPSLPDTVTPPDLLACKEVEGKLTIPSDARQKFLGDPLRSAEWKKLLKSFEKLHGSASTAAAPATPAPPATAPATPAGSPATDASPWKHIFEGEPRALTDLVAKYGEPSSTISAPGSSGFVIKVVEGPKFFLCAPVAGTFDCNEGPVLSHGAGSWLLDTKAEKMLQDSPDKAHVAKFESDQHLCILEDDIDENITSTGSTGAPTGGDGAKKEADEIENKKDVQVVKNDAEDDKTGVECEIDDKKVAVDKEEDLLQDPRFKKGSRLADFSPQGQAQLKEVRRLRAIENSNIWHNKFQSKGVPKNPAEPPPVAAAPEAAAEESSSSSSRPLTLKDAREKFMGDFFKEHKNNSEWKHQQKFKMANAAWMESDLRSRIMLARKGHGSIGAD